MRILAIRGCNITSLAGDFKLELDEPPLKNVGLFTITGPTGSGKSSLLDALCLALFGTAPRLDQSGSVRVGSGEDDDESLPVSDPRSLIRRGTSHGFAEVDFVGEGGHRYRARWEARRARNRITGRFQDWTISLENLDTGERVAQTKKETKAAIERALGLSYEQFRRSALLAQGDFAAFLKAPAGERAELLSQMTGTQLYERISVRAFERAKEADAALRVLQDSVAAVARLDEEARQKLVARIGELDQARAVKAKEVEELEKVVSYFDQATKLREGETEVIEQLAIAKEELSALEGLIEELRSVERALPLRDLVRAEEKAKLARTDAETHHASASDALRKAREALANAEALAATRLEERKRAEASLEESRPILAQASKLDAILREKEQQLVALRKQLEQASQATAHASSELSGLDQRIGSVRERMAGHEEWLTKAARVGRLVERWELYSAELSRFVSTFEDATRAREALAKLEREKAKADRTLAEIDEAIEKAAADLQAKKAAYEAASEKAQAHAFSDALRDERDAAVRMRQAVEAMLTLAARAQDLTKKRQAEQDKQAANRDDAERARAEAIEAEKALPRIEGELAEAKRALEAVQATMDLAAHRANLRDGEPCPLCGATEHPYAKDAGPLADLLASHKERVRERESHLQSLRVTMSRAQAKAETLLRTAAEIEERIVALDKEQEAIEAQWKEQTATVPLDLPPTDPAVLDALRDRQSKLDARLRELREAETLAAAHAQDARSKQQAWQAANASFEALVQEQRSAKDRTHETATAWSRQSDELERAKRSLESIADTLAPALEGRDGWRERLFETPAAFFENRKREVEEYKRRSEELAKAKDELSMLEAERKTKAAILEERKGIEAKHRDELLLREKDYAADRGERAKLLGGREVSEVQAELEGALAGATKALDEAKAAEQAAREEVQSASERLAAAKTALELATRDAETKEKELSDKLASTGFDRATLDALLSRDDAWIESSRKRIDEARTKVQEAEIRLGERQRTRTEHEKNMPAMSEEEARTKLGEARESLAATIEALAKAKADLERDDEARKLLAERENELARACKEAERWQVLNELIGSRDGKKFRTFAQSLTLDALLAYANEHLRDLAPRYRLMRVPGHDMELQVIDGDMADEVRGTNSLSGGETFLVSLALALALSSLASREVRIDTLFIDEGFGSLDPQTLDVAIAALESLQATGRQVGIISHVRALSEKIGTQVRVQRMGAGKSRLVLGRSADATVFG